MDYFKNVQSLSELKAQYRQLVLANHQIGRAHV